MQTLLNAMDGVIENPGRILIFTCNHPERLDLAFLRPGRIDHIIEFKKCNHAVICGIIANFYQTTLTKKHLQKLKQVTEYTKTPAELMALCKIHSSVDELIDILNFETII